MTTIQMLKHQLSIDLKAQQLFSLTTTLLSELIESEMSCNSNFNSSKQPSILLCDFLRRVHKYTAFSRECIILAIIYIDRYNLRVREFCLTANNVHKIILIALLLAAKFHDDEYYDLKAFEFAGGLSQAQIRHLEVEFALGVDFNFYVGEEQYEKFQSNLYNAYGGQGQSSDEDTQE